MTEYAAKCVSNPFISLLLTSFSVHLLLFTNLYTLTSIYALHLQMLPHISCEMNLSANRDIYCLVNCWQFYWAWNEIKIQNNTSIIFKEWHNKMLHIIAQCCLCSWQMIAVERLKIALTSWRRNSSESNITVAFPYVLAFCTPHTCIHTHANKQISTTYTYLPRNNLSVLSATSVLQARVYCLFVLFTHASFLFTLCQLPIQLRRRRYSARTLLISAIGRQQ